VDAIFHIGALGARTMTYCGRRAAPHDGVVLDASILSVARPRFWSWPPDGAVCVACHYALALARRKSRAP
jgi:hypothetical protein